MMTIDNLDLPGATDDEKQEYLEACRNYCRAHNAVAKAVRNGQLPHISKRSCFICSRQAHYHHHHSYEPKDWLDVVPVCGHCHHMLHGFSSRAANYHHRQYRYYQLKSLLGDTQEVHHSTFKAIDELKEVA